MEILTIVISILYYLLIALIAVILIYNLFKSKNWKEEILYVIILLPFLLRLFMLK